MPIFPGGVSRALAARDDFRRGPVAVSARSGPTGMTWGQLEAFLSGEVGRYSGGLISNARAYAESPWVAPSVHVFAATCAARIFRMFRETDGEKERILDHWLIDLMARPNPMARVSEYMLKYQTFALYDIDGEVLWHLGRTGQTKPAKEGKPKKFTAPDFITIFRKSEAQPVLDRRTNEFAGWNLSLDGTAYFADRDDVIHFPRFDPINSTAAFNPFTMKVREPARGRSALDSKRRALSADSAMSTFTQDFFSRGMGADYAFIGPADLSETKRDEFQDRLRARMAGKRDPVVLGGQWAIQKLGSTQKDAEFSQGRHDARDEILAGRIPPIYVGDRDATYANAQQQVLTWLESIVIPALTHFGATLDVNLLADEPDVWTDLATDDIYALQVAKKELVGSALDLVSRGKAPMDVAARTVGLEMETYEGSDIGFGTEMDVPVADLIGAGIDLDQPVAATADAAVPAPDQGTISVAADAATGVLLNGAQVTAATAIVVSVAEGKIPRDSGIGQLKVLFNLDDAQAEQIMGSAGKSDVPTTPNPNPADAAAQAAAAQQQAPVDETRRVRVIGSPTIRIVDATLGGEAAVALLELGTSIPDESLAENWRETDAHVETRADEKGLQALLQLIRTDDKDLQKLARRFHIRMLSEGAKQALKLTKPGTALTSIVPIDNPRVVEFLATRANLITSVNKTTGEQVFEAVKAGVAAGETPENIANEIRDVYNLRGKQARLIARQENGSALNGGRFLQFEEDGAEGIEWLSARDTIVRDSHAPNTGVDGEVVAIGEVFSNGCRYPQDPAGDKDEVLGCRCTSLPAALGGSRGSLFPNEKSRASYWRASVVVATRSSDKQFGGALQKYFNDQRGRVLAMLAELLAA